MIGGSALSRSTRLKVAETRAPRDPLGLGHDQTRPLTRGGGARKEGMQRGCLQSGPRHVTQFGGNRIWCDDSIAPGLWSLTRRGAPKRPMLSIRDERASKKGVGLLGALALI